VSVKIKVINNFYSSYITIYSVPPLSISKQTVVLSSFSTPQEVNAWILIYVS